MNKLVSVPSPDHSRPSNSQVLHPTPAQSQGIEEAYQAANQAANQRVETSRSNSVKPLPPKEIKGFRFKVTLSQRDHRLEVIDGIVRSRRLFSSGVDYRIDLSKIPCTVGEDGLKVDNENIPLAMIVKVKVRSENMSVHTMIERNRWDQRRAQERQLSNELAEIQQNLLTTLKTIGLDHFFVLKMPDLQKKYDSADSLASFNSNIRKSREEFAKEITKALTAGQMRPEKLETGMLESDLREFYGKEFDRCLKDFLGKQDEIRLRLSKPLMIIGLQLMDSKMPNLQQKFDNAPSFDDFKSNIWNLRHKLAGEMTTASTDGRSTGGQVSTEMIKDDLRKFYVEEFNRRLKGFLNSKDIEDLQNKFPEVTMTVPYRVKVGEVCGGIYRCPDSEGEYPYDGRKWVDDHGTRYKEDPADKKTFYERLGI